MSDNDMSRSEELLGEIANKLDMKEVGDLPASQSRMEILLKTILDKLDKKEEPGEDDLDPVKELEVKMGVLRFVFEDWYDSTAMTTTTVSFSEPYYNYYGEPPIVIIIPKISGSQGVWQRYPNAAYYTGETRNTGFSAEMRVRGEPDVPGMQVAFDAWWVAIGYRLKT